MANLPWTHRTLYQLTVAGLVFGQQVVNTFHFEAEATYDLANITDAAKQADSQLLALDWIANGKVPYLAQLPSDYAMQMITCQVLEVNGQWRHRLTPMETAQTTSPGTDATHGAVENLTGAGVIRWRTPIAGKAHRGRSYIGPLGQNAILDGRLASSCVTKLTAFKDAMVNRWTGAGASAGKWNLTIYSRPYNQGEYQYTVRDSTGLRVVSPPDYAGNSTFVTVGAVDNIGRVQRRREIGVGS
jgi:hypothetical protein